MKVNHDANWKFIIEELFPEFMSFFLPKLAEEIDYTQAPEFMEQELHKIVADKVKKGKVVNDKLVKVRLKNGEDKWVLIHIEIQGTFETHFSKRMFIYFYRILDKYDKEITALAVYTGNQQSRQKNKFNYNFYGTELEYKFNTYVAKDAQEKELLKSNNPFALVILAVKHYYKIPKDHNETFLFKLRLIRLCKEKGLNRRQIVSLFKFIDLTLQTSKELEGKFAKKAISILTNTTKEMELKGLISESYIGHLFKAVYGETFEEKLEKVKAKERERAEERAKERAKERERERERAKEKERERAEEREKERERAIKNLFEKLNLSAESVADILNLPLEKVLEVKKKIDA